jgi:hypothetical protein
MGAGVDFTDFIDDLQGAGEKGLTAVTDVLQAVSAAGFDVDTGDLRAAGERARAAGEQAGKLKPSAPLTAAAAGIPGAEAVEAMTLVGQRWERETKQLALRAKTHADRLGMAADTYDRADRLSSGVSTKLGEQLP